MVTMAGVRGHWGLHAHAVINPVHLSIPLAPLSPTAQLGGGMPVPGPLEYSQNHSGKPHYTLGEDFGQSPGTFLPGVGGVPTSSKDCSAG